MFTTFFLIFLHFLCISAQDNDEFLQYDDGDEKIVEGIVADMKDFYYQVSVRLNDKHYCGGAIITDRFVITAAHCTRLHVDRPRRLSIQAGTKNVGSAEGHIVIVNKIYQHDLFNETSLDYDMSLLELSEDLDFTALQRPIRVTRRRKFPLDAVVVVSGWGYTSEGGAMAQTLQAVGLPLIPSLACREYYPKALTPRMICAGYPLGGKDACQGDSGGPLVYNRELVGIVSWGRGCARPRRPGVYTKIAILRNFISKYAGIP